MLIQALEFLIEVIQNYVNGDGNIAFWMSLKWRWLWKNGKGYVYAQLNGVLSDETPSTWLWDFRWWWGILT